jgi:hypothetical protein
MICPFCRFEFDLEEFPIACPACGYEMPDFDVEEEEEIFSLSRMFRFDASTSNLV